MFIGELARLSATSPKAIRLYETLGLLGSVKRQGTYRIYSPHNLEQVQLVRQAQSLGFTLTEIAALMPALDRTPGRMEVLSQLERKRAAIRQEIGRLAMLDARIGRVSEHMLACPDQGLASVLPPGDEWLSQSPMPAETLDIALQDNVDTSLAPENVIDYI